MATCRACREDGATHEVPEPTWVQTLLVIPFSFGLVLAFAAFFGLLFVMQPLLLIEKALEFFSLGVPEGVQMIIGYGFVGGVTLVALVIPAGLLGMMTKTTFERWKLGPNILCDTCWEEREARLAAAEVERARSVPSYEPDEPSNPFDNSAFDTGVGRF